MNISLVVDHPNYNGGTTYNDYSLLKLDNKLDFVANSHIRPVTIITFKNKYKKTCILGDIMLWAFDHNIKKR